MYRSLDREVRRGRNFVSWAMRQGRSVDSFEVRRLERPETLAFVRAGDRQMLGIVDAFSGREGRTAALLGGHDLLIDRRAVCAFRLDRTVRRVECSVSRSRLGLCARRLTSLELHFVSGLRNRPHSCFSFLNLVDDVLCFGDTFEDRVDVLSQSIDSLGLGRGTVRVRPYIVIDSGGTAPGSQPSWSSTCSTQSLHRSSPVIL